MNDQLQFGEEELVALRDAWNKALDLLDGEINRPSFESFFRTAHPISFKDDTATIGAASELAKIFLEKYSHLIKTALESSLLRETKVEYVVSPQDKPRSRTSQAAKPSPKTGVLSPLSMPLNEKYVFGNFITGPSNRLAHAAAIAVSREPGKVYNPFFIYGGPGLGKTHLLQAIGHQVLINHPKLRVVYVSGECFTSHYINALREQRSEEFRQRYRNIDIWLIDDIQFLAGKERTKEEFFHTFNALHQSDKQIVISSDRPPRDLNLVEERLVSRFNSGLVADISPPDLETRIAILHKKARAEKADVSDSILECVAHLIPTNVRALEGALVTILAYSSLMKVRLTESLAEEILGRYISEKKYTELTPEAVLRAVAQEFSLDAEDIKGDKRQREIVTARHVSMYLLRELTELSLNAIGKAFNDRDHATVLHACNRVKSLLSSDSNLKPVIENLYSDLRSGRW